MKNKGQISPVVMWVAGGFASISLAFTGYVNNRVNDVEGSSVENNTGIVQRVTAVETDVKTIKEDLKDLKEQNVTIIKQQAAILQSLRANPSY
jgi:hypothetical protein